MVEDKIDFSVLTRSIWHLLELDGQQMLIVSRLLVQETLRSLFREEVIAFCSGGHSSIVIWICFAFFVDLSAVSKLILSVLSKLNLEAYLVDSVALEILVKVSFPHNDLIRINRLIILLELII